MTDPVSTTTGYRACAEAAQIGEQGTGLLREVMEKRRSAPDTTAVQLSASEIKMLMEAWKRHDVFIFGGDAGQRDLAARFTAALKRLERKAQ